MWPFFSQPGSLRISIRAIRASDLTEGHFDCKVKSVTHSHFTSFFTDSPRLEVNGLPITSPFPLSKLVKADPSRCPGYQARRQSSTHTIYAHQHMIHLFVSLIHGKTDRKRTHNAANSPTYRDAKQYKNTHRNVAVQSHDARRWLGGQDVCCQLSWESLTQHRAANRT